MHRNALFISLLTAACASAAVAPPVADPVDARFVARQQAMAQMARNFERVNFEFDSALITRATQDALFANIVIMDDFREIAVEVEGHCDETGSTEYNLALGQRRAQVIRKYMIAAGIEASRVRTISYGEEVPIDMSGAVNRRAEFRLSYAPHADVQGSVAGLPMMPVIVARND